MNRSILSNRTHTVLFSALLLFGSLPALATSLSVEVTDQSSAPLPDAVAYVLPVHAKVATQGTPTAIIDQIGRQFSPQVSVMQTGTSVRFPNKDNIRHHVYSFSPAKIFELRLYSGVPSQPVIFDKPGLVVLGCNIHDQMVAYVQIVDTPWFGKTDASGAIKIQGLPSGEYDLHVWHYRLPNMAIDTVQRIKVSGDFSVKTRLELKPQL